jgi:vancomycin resistance protein YoaR
MVVSEQNLARDWFFQESRKTVTGGKTLRQRAEGLTVGKSLDAFCEQLPELWNLLLKIEEKVNKPACDGTIKFLPGEEKKFVVTGARIGQKVDRLAFCRAMLNALQGDIYIEIPIPVVAVSPKSETEMISGIQLKASYETAFDKSNTNRANNIALALGSFHGKTIRNGETVSFNDVVGARTAARGYKEANIIIDGEFVQGVGGGVCQASTTLFNAVLLSGLKIVESHNHSLAIGYVPLGRDAMVSSSADFVFRNDSGSLLYIETFTRGGRAAVEIYGNKPRGVAYKPRVESRTFPVVEEVAGSVPVDISAYDKVTIEQGFPRQEAITYLYVYSGSRLINIQKIRKSHYRGKPRIVMYKEKVGDEPSTS